MKRSRLLLLAALLGLGIACTSVPSADTYVDFLYQYMPQPDQTDYSRDFYQHNVELSLQAREEMPWGKSVPEREFRHFVLPVRVNNEHLDNAREVFYAELKPRVEKLSMQDAILEVNHWCHEKATYRPTDARTSSPLATVKTAYGRCGEESTFLVAALRAVGIPARQVYTPRWAHTDDNHAWVEAWADGRWWFLGACEPEPVLNLGWFNESASRGMLMHTRVFGEYDGPEEVMSRSHYFTEINVTSTYAPVTRVDIVVVDEQDKPVPDALVEFKIYNYAEFFTAVKKNTDEKGRTYLTAGRGDMLVWASKDGRYAFKKVSFGEEPQTVTIKIGDEKPHPLTPSPRGEGEAFGSEGETGQEVETTLALDLTPPRAGASLPSVTPEQRAENDRRKAEEDSIRAAYEKTMPREEWRGNYAVIQQFLREQDDGELALRLVDALAPKDLRDVTIDVLQDNMVFDGETVESDAIPNDIFDRYVLSPRVENEHLVPYKQFFRKELKRFVGKSAKTFADWALKYVTIDDSRNPNRLRMSPLSVYRERTADRLSRNIFFVSAARSIGIPARINEINGKLEYWDKVWVAPEESKEAEESKEKREKSKEPATSESNLSSKLSTLNSQLKLTFSPTRFNDDPKYYTHFTLSRIVDGKLQLLSYPEEATWQNTFAEGQQLDPGQYMLTTGTRLASGGVLAHVTIFDIEPTQQVTIPLVMRESKEDIQVVGSLNAENLYMPTDQTLSPTSLLATAGRGYYMLGIIAPNQEPTNHALRDIAACAKELEQWGRKLILLFESEDDARRFNFAEHSNLPAAVAWGIDKDGTILSELQPLLKSNALPVFVIADSFNRVVFVQQGYTIGLGDQLVKVKRKL